jgi:LacI family transcriptional regulator
MKEITCIVTDDTVIGEMAAKHFLDKGFSNFAYCGLDRMHWSRNRSRSFQEFVRQAGFNVHIYKQPKSKLNRSWRNEQIILAKWLKELPKPIGLLACNDDRAQYVIEACKTADIKIPDQIAILGVDNDKLICNLANPPFSSIALNVERAGYEAADLLDRLMNGEKMTGKPITVYPTHVEERQSTDFLAVTDHEVAIAIRFIKDHTRELLQVDDVVEASGLSRRVLEKRFRRVLHHSVFEMIKNARTEQVIRLLVETNMSVASIARTLKFPGAKHVARSFRQVTGMTPIAYRKKYGQK